MSTRRLERPTSRVSVVRGQLDHLLCACDRHRQAPLEYLVAGQLRQQPPTARRKHDRSVALFVELSANRRTPLHSFLQEVFETLTGTWFAQEFVMNGYDVDGKSINGNVQRRA